MQDKNLTHPDQQELAPSAMNDAVIDDTITNETADDKALSRRRFLQAGAVTAAGLAVAGAAEPVMAQLQRAKIDPKLAAMKATDLVADPKTGGVLMFGEGNAIYFLPGDILEQFRLDNARSKQVTEYVGRDGVVPLLSAVPGRVAKKWKLAVGDDDATVILNNASAIRRIRR
jgi:hypothetical protein